MSLYVNNGLKLAQQFFGQKDNWDIYTHQISFYGDEVLKEVEEGDKVLDIGYGYCGITFACLNKGCYVDAIDLFIEPPPIPEVNWYYPWNVENPKSFLKKDYYDVIIMTEVFEHLNFRPEQTISRLYDALKVGGKLILTVPTKGVYYPEPEDKELEEYDDTKAIGDQHIKFYSDLEILELFGNKGQMIKTDHFMNHSFFVFCKK